MPYSLTESQGVLRVAWTGPLNSTDLHALLNVMDSTLSGRAAWPDNLIDFRGLETSSLRFTDIMSLAKRRELVAPPNPIYTAFVADQPVIVGFVRMFQSVNQNPRITSQLFATLDEAEAWLRAQRVASLR